jgi:hypothetical protein
MADGSPTHAYTSNDEAARDTELQRIIDRAEDVQRRAKAVDTDAERLTADVERWARDHGVDESTFGLLLRLVTLPPVMHQTVPARTKAGMEYGRLETAAISLMQRRRALSEEFIAVHEDFHDWARTYGVELESETVERPMRLTGIYRMFSSCPNGSVPCSWRCSAVGTNGWLDSTICNKMKQPKLKPT